MATEQVAVMAPLPRTKGLLVFLTPSHQNGQYYAGTSVHQVWDMGKIDRPYIIPQHVSFPG